MDVYQHINLLERYDRTAGIFKALHQFVQRGDILIDAGSGSGLISFLSLKAGADYIYSIERDPIIEVSKKIAADNQLSEQITFIKEDIDKVSSDKFTRRIDGLIAFVYLNDPRRDERQHTLIYDFVSRLGLKGIKLIPNKIKYYAYLAHSATHDILNHRTQIGSRVLNLQKRYELDFGSLLAETENSIDYSFFPQRNALGGYSNFDKLILSDCEEWMEVDYTKDLKVFPSEVNFKMTRDGIPNCVIWSQDLIYEDLVIFNNQSISFITNPCFLGNGVNVRVQLDDAWRRSNLLSIS